MSAREKLATLKDLERKVLWLSAWTIHNANHIRPNDDGLKVGGHQASCASIASLMTALYFSILRPEDRVAVKPHAAPVFHAIQYLLGKQSKEKLIDFRGYGGAQSYPSRTKDTDDVDFSTGSVGLGVAITAFASMVQDYVRARGWGHGSEGRMIALVGDAELDEGNIYECLQEGWKQGLRNTWWIIDYNRQSLDGVVREGLSKRVDGIFSAFGWDVVLMKYGVLQRAAFEEPGGEALRDWIDDCPNQLYSALTYQGGKAWRERLSADIGGEPDVADLLSRRSDEALAELMENLGGHCLQTILETLGGIDHDRPVAIIAYTVKGWGTPLAGHKDNHAGLMTAAQMEAFQASMNIRGGHEWDHFEGLATPPADLAAFLKQVPFSGPMRRHAAKTVPVPQIALPADRAIATQTAFGKILNDIAASGSALADRIVTTSPDVTVSTNLGPWVNRRNLFSRTEIADTFHEQRVPSAQKWRFSPDGQHIELGIAEMNLFLLLGAAGLSHSLFGERLLPIGTLYDPFIARGLDALNYACYQDARFMLVATPSGVSLAPEGGAHQSVGSPLIGMSQDGIAAFEPAFADELAAIMEWAFAYMQRDGEAVLNERTWLRDETGGSVYLRLSTRAIEQPPQRSDDAFRQGVIDGAYWLREPGPGCDVVIAYQGVVATEAIAAAGTIGDARRNVGVLAVTSADRLNAGWQAAQRERIRGNAAAISHIERLLQPVSRDAAIVTVIDGHPATMSWLGGVCGHRAAGLGVEHFGQTGTVADLYAHFGIDANSIAATAARLLPGRPVRLAI
ncbi:transketolase [Nitratireductor sp. XY-223]|uniref:transketolase n=1 Tax=Nitratireductor sp. XY-223 TaxID=2561926 RepID=UPI0010AA54DC|nr:transketolase [Nitratireductor sp. XY-223]